MKKHLYIYPVTQKLRSSIFGYFHFFVGAFLVYDIRDMKNKYKAIGIIYGIGIVAVCIFGPLGMI